MSTTLTVGDMNCEGCVDIITGALGEVSGVDSVDADIESKTVVVEGDASSDDVLEAVKFAGYRATVESAGGAAGASESESESADETPDAADGDEEGDVEAADDVDGDEEGDVEATDEAAVEDDVDAEE